MEKWIVVDRKTQQIVGEYQTMRRALRRADKLDMAHGAYRYSVKKV